MTLFEIFIFTAWTLAVFGFGYYFGMDRRDRENETKKIIDNLEVADEDV